MICFLPLFSIAQKGENAKRKERQIEKKKEKRQGSAIKLSEGSKKTA
jgi:hypothetical protein